MNPRVPEGIRHVFNYDMQQLSAARNEKLTRPNRGKGRLFLYPLNKFLSASCDMSDFNNVRAEEEVPGAFL